MGENNKLGLPYLLWKHKIAIILAIAVVILAASTYYYYRQSNDRADALGQKTAEYDDLNTRFQNLSAEHAELTISNENLSQRFVSLNYTYNDLLTRDASLLSDYEQLNSTVYRFQEKNGAQLALSYKVRRGVTADGSRVFVDATVYNVGDSKADRIVIKCKIIYEYQPNVDEHVITDLGPLDKKSITWDYPASADIDALWI